MDLRVYWQPGCSSCLKAKEFLNTHGIAFESVNVAESPAAIAELQRLGARTVPVVSDGQRFIMAQDLAELAGFVGVAYRNDVLAVDVLADKLLRIVQAAQRYIAQIPDVRLGTMLRGRDRSWRDLAHHVFVIPRAFVRCTAGEELTFEQFLELPAGDAGCAALAAFGHDVEALLHEWRARGPRPQTVRTFYGERSMHSVLERTVWHAGQHCRQLQDIVHRLGLQPDGPLGEAELAGLPLPQDVWDDQIEML